MNTPAFNPLPSGLFLLELPQPMPGFYRFISSWFFTCADGRRVLVDPGPASAAPELLKKLSSITDGLDLILLTHIHLDHSGGVGEICRVYGGAKVAAHRKAGRHLTNPGKLWKASLETLGGVAEMYGEPTPLTPEKLAGYEELGEIEFLETPGHAPHHICFIAPLAGRPSEKLFFAGEAAGMRLPIESGAPYVRPATPPKFDADAARESLAKIKNFVRGGELMCYGHWGAERDPAAKIFQAEGQLALWLGVVSDMLGEPAEDITSRLIESDPLMAGYAFLPEDLRTRELIFIGNSVKGLADYLSK